MTHIIKHIFLAGFLWPVLLSAVFAADQQKVVGGIEVFYGVMPAEIIKQHSTHEAAMHDKRLFSKGTHHLVVSLYKQGTTQRITDATVEATIMPFGLATDTKPLEPMMIDNTITYGNYFNLPKSSSPFRIVLKIKQPNAATPVTAEFDYRPAD